MISATDNSKLEFVFRDSKDGINGNVLVLLHGLGDKAENFIKFGEKMELPQTAIVALQGPNPIPFFEGSCWYPAFNLSTGEEMDESHPLVQHTCSQTLNLLSRFIRDNLLSSKQSFINRWPMDRIFVVGFGQGGTMALGVAGIEGLEELGGCISISGPPLPTSNEFKPPCLLTYGSLEKTYNSRISKFRRMKNLELFCVPGRDRSMPKDSTEMHQIMKFLGSKLALRNLKLESQADVYEIK